MNFSNKNNFDLIRLFAASQVALIHAEQNMGINLNLLLWLDYFPGVPIFFFISGFLLYNSYKKNCLKQDYFKYFFINRILRIYPALFISFFISIFLIWLSGYFTIKEFSIFSFIIWCFTSLTMFQFFNPEFLRDFGIGVVNGSLWTISVEIQFYILTPLIFYFLRKDFYYKTLFLTLFFVFFVICNILNFYLNNFISIYEKLYGVSFFPWLYMFILGAIIAKHPTIINFILRFNIIFLLTLYIILYWLNSNILNFGIGNHINPVSYSLLVMIIIKTAFSKPYLSDKLLKGNDLSYGIYVYHGPIQNYLIHVNFIGYFGFFTLFILVLLTSFISWFFVEKFFLSFKKIMLRKV